MQRPLQKIEYVPIGLVRSRYTRRRGTPRQGALFPDSEGRIEIFKEYKEALKDLDSFEYIIILFHFDRVKHWEALVDPPASNHEHRFGLFSTRSPKRPNPIGLTVLKLEKIEDSVLYVRGLDAFDGTPVLDIKPYLPSVDLIESRHNEVAESRLNRDDGDSDIDGRFSK